MNSSTISDNVVHIQRPEEEIIHINQDIPMEIHDNNSITLDDTFSLVKTYFDKKFTGLKRELTENQLHQSKEKRLKRSVPDVDFKYKSNKKQFEFNNSIAEKIDEVMDLLENGAINRPIKRLGELKDNINKRNKLIRMADRSVAGWNTVEEYMSDDLASNSDDEKKIRAAERRAIAKRKTNKPLPNNRSNFRVQQPSASFTFRPPNHSISGRPGFGANTQFPGSYQQFGQRQPKPTDICLSCGQAGHWRNYCPNKNPNSFGRPKQI